MHTHCMHYRWQYSCTRWDKPETEGSSGSSRRQPLRLSALLDPVKEPDHPCNSGLNKAKAYCETQKSIWWLQFLCHMPHKSPTDRGAPDSIYLKSLAVTQTERARQGKCVYVCAWRKCWTSIFFSSLFLIPFLCRSTLWHINWNFVGLLNGCAHALSQRSRLRQATCYPCITCLWFNSSCLNCSACAPWPKVNRLALESYSTLIFLFPASCYERDHLQPVGWGLHSLLPSVDLDV